MEDIEEVRDLMFKMWDRADKTQKKIESLERRLKRFGVKRWIFFFRFSKINAKLKLLKEVRFTTVSIALALSKKINAHRRVERAKRKVTYDH